MRKQSQSRIVTVTKTILQFKYNTNGVIIGAREMKPNNKIHIERCCQKMQLKQNVPHKDYHDANKKIKNTNVQQYSTTNEYNQTCKCK